MAPSDDLTAIATLVLAGITLGLAAATIALVLVTRAGAAQARADAQAAMKVLERQVAAGYRPLLVDVPMTAPVPPDMGAQWDVDRPEGPHVTRHYPGPVIETRLPEIEPRLVDPRSAFVEFAGASIFVSVPLRNVGRGLAVVDGGEVELTGAFAGPVRHRTVQREHVPVGETTRIDLVLTDLRQQAPDHMERGHMMQGIAWQLTVPYCDFAGEQRSVAQLQIVCRGDTVEGPWLVEHVKQESPREPEGQERSRTVDALPDAGSAGLSVERRRLLDVRSEPVTDLWGKPRRPKGTDR